MPILALALSLFVSPVLGAKFDARCPEEIAPTQALPAAPQGWRPFFDKVNTRHYLDGVRFFSGPPEELADLVPDASGGVSRWVLSGPAGIKFWQVCTYYGTSAMLTRELPSSIKVCEVEYHPTKGKDALRSGSGGPIPRDVRCK